MTPWRLAVQRGTACRDLRGFGERWRERREGEPTGTPKGLLVTARRRYAVAVREDHPCCRQPGPGRSMLRRVQVVHRGHRIGRIAPRKYSTLQPANDSVNDGLERHDIFAAFGNACKCQSPACAEHIRTGSTRPSPAVTGGNFFAPENRREWFHYPTAPPPSRTFEKKAPGKTRGLASTEAFTDGPDRARGAERRAYPFFFTTSSAIWAGTRS